VDLPGRTALATPDSLTETALLEDRQLTLRWDITLPSLSMTSAFSCRDWPSTKLAELGVTLIERPV
jgi:hypothetical protein